MTIQIPKKRHSILYVRISSENKAWLEKAAKNANCSLSVLLDSIVDKLKKDK